MQIDKNNTSKYNIGDRVYWVASPPYVHIHNGKLSPNRIEISTDIIYAIYCETRNNNEIDFRYKTPWQDQKREQSLFGTVEEVKAHLAEQYNQLRDNLLASLDDIQVNDESKPKDEEGIKNNG